MKKSGQQFGLTGNSNEEVKTINQRPTTTKHTAAKKRLQNDKDVEDDEYGESYDYDDEVSYYSDNQDGDES